MPYIKCTSRHQNIQKKVIVLIIIIKKYFDEPGPTFGSSKKTAKDANEKCITRIMYLVMEWLLRMNYYQER